MNEQRVFDLLVLVTEVVIVRVRHRSGYSCTALSVVVVFIVTHVHMKRLGLLLYKFVMIVMNRIDFYSLVGH